MKKENNNKQRKYIIFKKINESIMMYMYEILYKDKEYKKIINKGKE